MNKSFSYKPIEHYVRNVWEDVKMEDLETVIIVKYREDYFSYEKVNHDDFFHTDVYLIDRNTDDYLDSFIAQMSYDSSELEGDYSVSSEEIRNYVKRYIAER